MNASGAHTSDASDGAISGTPPPLTQLEAYKVRWMRAELVPGQSTVDLMSRVDVCPGANMSPPECKCRTPPPLAGARACKDICTQIAV